MWLSIHFAFDIFWSFYQALITIYFVFVTGIIEFT